MVVVKIELWPKGHSNKARLLGMIVIANDGTGTDTHGNYNAALSHAGKYYGKPGAYKTGRVEKHPRLQSPYHLLYKVLKNCLYPAKG